jgi:hypothetical protein
MLRIEPLCWVEVDACVEAWAAGGGGACGLAAGGGASWAKTSDVDANNAGMTVAKNLTCMIDPFGLWALLTALGCKAKINGHTHSSWNHAKYAGKGGCFGPFRPRSRASFQNEAPEMTFSPLFCAS